MFRLVRYSAGRLLSVLLCLAVLVAVVPNPAYAQAPKVDLADEVISLASKVTPFMHRNDDGTYDMKATAKQLGVSEAALSLFTRSLAAVNQGIRQGVYKSDAEGHLFVTGEGQVAQSQSGIGTLDWGCIGRSVTLTEQQTSKMEGMLNMAAGGAAAVAVVAGFLLTVVPPTLPVTGVVALAAGIVSAGTWFFAAWMQTVDNGRGDTIRFQLCVWGATGVFPVAN